MAEPLYDVIDADGQKTGRQATKQQALDEGLLLQFVQVWIFNSKGQLLVGQRAEGRKVRPNLLDAGCAGHVDAGEDYDTTAKRELKEELGLELPLDYMFDIADPAVGRAKIYRAILEDIPPFDKSEMNLLEFRDMKDLDQLIASFPYLTAMGLRQGIEAYKRWVLEGSPVRKVA